MGQQRRNNEAGGCIKERWEEEEIWRGWEGIRGHLGDGGRPRRAVHAERGIVIRAQHDGKRPERHRGLLGKELQCRGAHALALD
jgi:hypothetical protein